MKDIRICSIEIKNYKLCKDTKILLNGNLTALLGKNGAGKTTILQAIELLHSATSKFPETTPIFDNVKRKEYDVTTVVAEIEWLNKRYRFSLEAFFQKDAITAKPKKSLYSLTDLSTKKKYQYQDIQFILAYSNIKYQNNLESLLRTTSKTPKQGKQS